MRVGISTLGADDLQAGLGRFAVSLLHGMARVADDAWEFEVIVQRETRSALMPAHSRWRAAVAPGFVRGNIGSIFWHQAILPGYCRSQNFDALLLLAANRRLPWPLLMRAAHAAPMVGVVHDLGAFRIPGKDGLLRDAYTRRLLTPMIRGLDHVLAVSQSTRSDIVKYAGVPEQGVSVVPLGVHHSTFCPGDAVVAGERMERELGITGPYLLYPSRLEHPGKNHVRLINAFARLKERIGCPHRLVLAGRDWRGSDPIREAARQAGPAVVMAGYIPEHLLPDLYRAASALVFPSLHEGFGLPVVEAMACGLPVACSNASSMPEVAGDAAVFFDPHSEGEIERAMEAILDPSVASSLRKKAMERAHLFDWDRTAEMTLQVLEDVAIRCRR